MLVCSIQTSLIIVCVTYVFVHSSPGMNDSMMKCVSEDSFDEDNLRKEEEEEGKEEASETTSLLSGSKTYVWSSLKHLVCTSLVTRPCVRREMIWYRLFVHVRVFPLYFFVKLYVE